MLDPTARILDFDGSLIRQQALLARYRPDIIDCTRLGPAARLWASETTAAAIRKALSPLPGHAVTLTGSGDFHHVSHLLLSRFAEPLTLIVFDFHPDWDLLPPRLGCGSWVSRALGLAHVDKVILLGPSSADLAPPALYTGNLQAFKSGRLELYPYERAPSRVLLRRVPDNPSLRVARVGPVSTIGWTCLRGRDLRSFMKEVLGRCGAGRAYVSIDKDCLRAEHALTNWEEGRLSLDELLVMLEVIRDTMDIIGADITGEYSAPVLPGPCKRFCSRLDHPADYTARTAPADRINAVNERTNLALLELLLKG